MTEIPASQLTAAQLAYANNLLSDAQIKSYWEVISSLNKGVNLVSRETNFESFRRLVCESIYPLCVLEQNFPGYIDIGSGGGIPAIPLLLTGRVRQPSELYERIGKKAEALRAIVASLGLFATVKSQNFGERPVAETVSLITLRLVAPEPRLVRQIVLSLGQDGVFVYYGLKSLPPIPGFHARRYILSDTSGAGNLLAEPRGFTILSR